MKKTKKDLSKKNIISFFLGIVFLLAAVYRIFNPKAGIEEFNAVGVPIFFLYVTILFELTVGTLLILGKKLKLVSVITMFFLVIAIIIATLSDFKGIIHNIGELFVLDSTPTDIVLHITFLIMLIHVFLNQNK